MGMVNGVAGTSVGAVGTMGTATGQFQLLGLQGSRMGRTSSGYLHRVTGAALTAGWPC